MNFFPFTTSDVSNEIGPAQIAAIYFPSLFIFLSNSMTRLSAKLIKRLDTVESFNLSKKS